MGWVNSLCGNFLVLVCPSCRSAVKWVFPSWSAVDTALLVGGDSQGWSPVLNNLSLEVLETNLEI